MATNVGICNLALSHIGVGKEITNLETEKSQEAAACRRFFDEVRDLTLRDFEWPFATKIAALGLIEEEPNDEWAYSYRYPTDCLLARRILSGQRTDTEDSSVKYKISQDASGIIIYTDKEDAELEYTVKTENPSYFPSDFTMAFSYRLAALIAPRLTGGDPFKTGDRAQKLYDMQIAKAKSTSINEEQSDQAPESEFIRSRD